jgi:YggT family protein
MAQKICFALSALIGVYSLVILFRIVLSWFSGFQYGHAYRYLRKITDPYLYAFRRFRFLRAGSLDLSPVAALLLLNIANSILVTAARAGTINAGIIFAIILSALWSTISFIMGFYVVVLMLRLIAYCVNADIYAPLWKLIDSLARPLIYHISRLFLRGRTGNYLAAIVISILILLALSAALWILVPRGIDLLYHLPL